MPRAKVDGRPAPEYGIPIRVPMPYQHGQLGHLPLETLRRLLRWEAELGRRAYAEAMREPLRRVA